MNSLTEIKLVSIGQVDSDLIEYLCLVLSESFAINCRSLDAILDPRPAYSATRQQYHSTQLLKKLIEIDGGNEEVALAYARASDSNDDGDKILGVADVDLFIPIFTFVFGEAQVNGRAALMSAYRLRQQFYGLRDDKGLFFARCEKEATHELGHAFGLGHCASYDCVMHFSNSIEQVDLKSNEFCPTCDRLRKRALETQTTYLRHESVSLLGLL